MDDEGKGKSESTIYRKRKRYEQHQRMYGFCNCETCSSAVSLSLHLTPSTSRQNQQEDSASDTRGSSTGGSSECHWTESQLSNNTCSVSEGEVMSSLSHVDTSSLRSEAGSVSVAMQHTLSDEKSFPSEPTEHSHQLQGGIVHDFLTSSEDIDNLVDNPGSSGGGSGPGPSSNSSSSNSDNSDSSDSSESDSDEDDDEGDHANLNLRNASLDAVLEVVRNHTAREAIALFVAVTARYNNSYESLIGTFRSFNSLLGHKFLPDDKKKFWRILGKKDDGILRHAYCDECLSSLGLLSELPVDKMCECGKHHSRKNVRYFITLNFTMQILQFLNTAGVATHLGYREARKKQAPDTVEDIFDGEAYRELQRESGPMRSQYDFTYLINTDGFQLTKSGNEEAWPLFIRLNEVSPNLRQKHVFLLGLWIDARKPNFNIFLEDFIREANHLSSVGVRWKPNNTDEVVSKFFPTCLCVDAKARCKLLNHKDVNGEHGCTLCTHKGVKLDGCMKFPFQTDPAMFEFEEPQPRTDEELRNNMMLAAETGKNVMGSWGACQLMNLHHFSLIDNQVIDDLHPVYEGAAEYHTYLFFEHNILTPEKVRIIDRRMTTIETPTSISRKPRLFSKREKYKGSEWRNWLVYYSIPCLRDLIPAHHLSHWALLANVAFLMSNTVITPHNFEEADRCVDEYVRTFQQVFGPECMRFNIHILTHGVRCARMWGPWWTHSTMPFESWNFRLLKLILSPKARLEQVVNRYFLWQLVSTVPFDNTISAEVKHLVETISSSSPPRQNVTTVGEAHFLGNGIATALTAQERVLLHEEQIHSRDTITEFQRVLWKGMELRTTHYKMEGKSKNCYAYTADDVLCKIEKIFSVTDVQGNIHCGVFVIPFYPIAYPPNAGYVVEINEGEVDDMIFVPLSRVRCLCVRLKVLEKCYIIPLTNHSEID